MDPNATLAIIRALCGQILKDGDADYRTDLLVSHFENLDAWITSGGFLPASWVRS